MYFQKNLLECQAGSSNRPNCHQPRVWKSAAAGIGSVKSYDDYMARMTTQYGHKASFLQEVDLDRKGIFHENKFFFFFPRDAGAFAEERSSG
jgi:hypothetical protein